MEAIAVALQDYKEIVGKLALITTVAQFFSPGFICYDIKKQGNTDNIPVMPFLGGLVISVLNLQFGMMLRDDTMIQVSFSGIALNVIYVCWYYFYTKSKGSVWTQIGLAGAFTAAIIGYTIVEEPTVAEQRLGMIVTVLMMTLIASPLFGLKEIIKTKSTAGMPFPIIFSGTIVSFLWLLYGIILRNEFIVFQNVIALGLSVIQLGLMAIYPSKPAKASGKGGKSKKSKKDN